MLMQGTELWNQWVQIQPYYVHVDLSNADLRGANLSGANLWSANLSGANLSGANLFRSYVGGANLSKANLSNANLQESQLRGARLNEADLRNADLSDAILGEAAFIAADLSGTNLFKAHLYKADFSRARLFRANLYRAELVGASFKEANLSGATLVGARLQRANFSEAHLIRANLSFADLSEANFSGANLSEVTLEGAILSFANLSNADLSFANLSRAILVKTNLTNASLNNCFVYGISVWDVQLVKTDQLNLSITDPSSNDSIITVDNLEVAQFIYLLLNYEKLRDVLNAVTERGVLLLGRFSGGGLEVLQAIAAKLREESYLPIIFDFERPKDRNYTETIKTLAGLSRFVIADLSGPSVPQELYATIPHFKIPFVPIIEANRKPFSMSIDLLEYPWVVKPPVTFVTTEELLEQLPAKVIAPAEEKRKARQKLLDELFNKV